MYIDRLVQPCGDARKTEQIANQVSPRAISQHSFIARVGIVLQNDILRISATLYY